MTVAHGRVRRVLLLGAVLVTAMLAAACGGAEPTVVDDAPRPLTGDEANQLAVVRFTQFANSPVSAEITYPGSPQTRIRALLDLRDHVAYGSFDTLDDGGEVVVTGLIAWDFDRVVTASVASGSDEVPEVGAWTGRALTLTNARDIFFALAINLGSDRPENASLLLRSSARYLRADQVDGDPVSVLEGPQPATSETADEPTTDSGRTRYWIDGEGALRRFEAFLGDASGDFASITLTDGVELPDGLEVRAREVLRALAR